MDRDVPLALEQYNPWLVDHGCWPAAAARFLPDRMVPRSASPRLEPDRVEVVVGPRRAGKSTLIWATLRRAARSPLVVNLNDRVLRRLCVSGARLETYDRRGDGGPLIENFGFTELLKHPRPLDEVRFWRSKSGGEVDFGVLRGDRFLPIEVKAFALGRPTLSCSARSFIEAYRPRAFLVVGLGIASRRALGDTTVIHCPPTDPASAVEEGLSDRS